MRSCNLTSRSRPFLASLVTGQLRSAHLLRKLSLPLSSTLENTMIRRAGVAEGLRRAGVGSFVLAFY